MNELLDARSIFLNAVEIEAAGERAAFLDEACGDDSALRGRVEALLRAYDDPDSFFEQPLRAEKSSGEAPTIAQQRAPEQAGATVGRYKLLQQIGEGGFGIVYMAEQSEPVRRKVALKIIKPGMDSRQVIARFEAERQALAMMDHHNIARVLDAGTTEAGLPYFVMELVKGVPITEYCDNAKLSPQERLELFIPVCHAVQHAHQKGVIHRDLKPSNVLVALYDGRPVPKVIDFGIAKATQQRLTERTMFTELGQIVGTFQYMSPEQAEMNQLDIDTRSDVYSLGVLLYELLAGSTPIAMQELREAGLVEMLRTIREIEPPKPSTRLSESGDAIASISTVRKTEPDKLARLLRGDLDWIVMKSLEKDRSRRYESASDLAADIERHLHQEPVLAAAPSAAYRMRKFASRNKSAVVAASLLAISLVGFGVVSACQAQIARTAADRARHAEQAAQQSLQSEQVARQTAEQDRQEAEIAKAQATESKELAFDQLARSQYEQARAIRLSNEPGGRFLALNLLEKAEQLRSRQRDEPADEGDAAASSLPAGNLLRSEAVANLLKSDGQVIRSWDGKINSVSPNGRFLAYMWINAEANDGGVRVVEIDTGRRLYDASGEAAKSVLGTILAISSDASRLAALQMDFLHIQLIDLETKKVERTLTMPGGKAGFSFTSRMEFSPDGRWLVASTGKTINIDIVVWDLADPSQTEGRKIATIEKFPLATASFDADSKRLAWVSGPHEATLWNLAEGQVNRTIELPLRLDGTIQFLPKGSKIVVHGYRTEERKAKGEKVADKLDAKQDAEKKTKEKEAETKEAETNDKGSGRGKRADQEPPGYLLVWDFEQQQEVAQYPTNQSAAIFPGALGVSSDGERVVVGQINGKMQVVDLKSREEYRLDHSGAVMSLCWTPDGKRLVSAGPGRAKLWEVVEHPALVRHVLKTDSAKSTINRLAASPDDKTVAIEFNGAKQIRLYDLETNRLVRKLALPVNQFSLASLQFSPDGKQLVRFGSETVLIWDLDKETPPQRVKQGNLRGWSIASAGFRKDGTILLGGLDKMIPTVKELQSDKTIWKLKTRQLGATTLVAGSGKLVVSQEQSPQDGSQAPQDRSPTIGVWELPSGNLLQRFPSAGKGFFLGGNLEISPDQHWLLEYGTEQSLATAMMPNMPGARGAPNLFGEVDQPWQGTVWDVATGKKHGEVRGDSSAEAAVFSPDGRYLAVSERNGNVLVWDVAANQQLFSWRAWPREGSIGNVTHNLAFTNDSSRLAVADGETSAINRLDIIELRRELAKLGLDW